MVSIDTKYLDMAMGSGTINMKHITETKRIESKSEVQTYLSRLHYALSNGSAKINFQCKRHVDEQRDQRYTNRYTIGQLFPDEDEVEVLKRELSRLTVEEYIETVKDIRFCNQSEMRVFGRKYSGADVYIKIRVELLNTSQDGYDYVFVMSFHYAEIQYTDNDFPFMRV